MMNDEQKPLIECDQQPSNDWEQDLSINPEQNLSDNREQNRQAGRKSIDLSKYIKNDIKGVIFDVDGVLLDSLGIWKDLGARYLISIGKRPEEGLSAILFSMSMEQGAEYLRTHYSLSQTSEEVLDGLKTMLRDFYFYEVTAKAGVLDLLRSLKEAGISITAATSSPRAHIEKALERCGLLGYISRLFTDSEVGKSKHFPDIYDAAAGSMDTSPGETVVFEDSLYALKTASAAGYLTIGICDVNGEPDQEGLREAADAYIRDMDLCDLNLGDFEAK